MAWPDNCKEQHTLKSALPISAQCCLSQTETNDHGSPGTHGSDCAEFPSPAPAKKAVRLPDREQDTSQHYHHHSQCLALTLKDRNHSAVVNLLFQNSFVMHLLKKSTQYLMRSNPPCTCTLLRSPWKKHPEHLAQAYLPFTSVKLGAEK